VRTSLRAALVVVAAACAASPSAQAGLTPIAYAVRFAVDARAIDVEATFPSAGQASIDLMMPVWSPGFYRIENYATRIGQMSARTSAGAAVEIEKPAPNRWRIAAGGSSSIVLSYRVAAAERSVTTNWVSADYAVVNGAPTFITFAEQARRPHDVRISLPPPWKASATGLDRASDRSPDHYTAADYDALVDSPIVAGNPSVQEFDVGGSHHVVVEVGDAGSFDAARAADDLHKVVQAQSKLWGGLPFRTYAFLLVFRPGGGGLEHRNSMLATTQAASTQTPAAYSRWLNFISHEYAHAFNVKRLRPIELGPFDYEHEVRTSGLWISEGFTTYFGNLAVTRAGLTSGSDFLAAVSAQIGQLQAAPGRLRQTLEQSSLDVWTSEGVSGVNTNAATSVSYYTKGAIVGFLLDAKIRRASGGGRSLDDVMRLALKRYGGERGFTAEEFRRTASEVAGVDLTAWFASATASTDELDYEDALDWYGLRFAPGAWTLEARPDATGGQRARLASLFTP
jgi:predicted metalloprotease with PDZ domain